MPALPAVSKVVRVDHFFQDTGGSKSEWRNFFQYSGALSVTDATTWLTNIVAALGTFMTARIDNNTSCIRSELTDLTSNTSAQVQNTTGHTGGVAINALPAGTAMVIKRQIVRRYRGGHPRIYLGGMDQSYLLNTTTWTTTALNNVTTSFVTYINACIANTNPAAIGTITAVNVSYFLGFHNVTLPSGRVKSVPTPRGTPVVDLVTGYIANPIVASQRRRNEQP